ncbi:MAG: hypothetical protein Q9170_000532 [Blastenia crenularia]
MNNEASESTFNIPSDSRHLSDDASTSQSLPEPMARVAIGYTDSEQQPKEAAKDFRKQYLDHLIRQLDIVIYCQFSILYYMDCSLFAFLVRGLNHWFYFTPKPAIMAPIITWGRPHIITIFALNLVNGFMHAISTPPTAGEAVRGYLHGGLLIDLVGQKSPVSRLRLVWCDVLILILQLVMLSVTVEKKRLDASSDRSTSADGAEREEEMQDHDSEERGVRRIDQETEQIELQSLQPRLGDRTGGEEDGERNESLGADGPTLTEHTRDAFYSGQYVLANIDIAKIIRDQWKQSKAMASGNPGNSVGAAAAAELARRRLRFRIRIGGREYGP